SACRARSLAPIRAPAGAAVFLCCRGFMIVITGGAGFIGSNLVAALEARGKAGLVVADHLGQSEKWRNLGKRELLAMVKPGELLDYLAQHRPAIMGGFP